MQNSQYPQNRAYQQQQRPQAGNLQRQQHTPQHLMNQQQPQHQGQPQGNQQQQQQARTVMPQMAHPPQYFTHPQPVYVYPQIAAQAMPATGQGPAQYPRLYTTAGYHPGYAGQFQTPVQWNPLTMTQPQQGGLQQAYYQTAVVPGQVQAQQLQAAAHQHFYSQTQGTQMPWRGVNIAAAPPQMIRHQTNQQGHHSHPQQHVQSPQVQVQPAQPPPPPPQDTREAPPAAPRGRKVLNIIDPSTGQSVIETPPVPPPASSETSATQNDESSATSARPTEELEPTPSPVVPALVVPPATQPVEDAKPTETEETSQFPKSCARAEFYHKISKSAEEDRPAETTPSPNGSRASPIPTSSSAAGPVENDTTPQPQTTLNVQIDNDVKVERHNSLEVVETFDGEESKVDVAPIYTEENSLADISSVSIDRYVEDDTPEVLANATEPSVTIICEPEKRLAESPIEENKPQVDVKVVPLLVAPAAPTPLFPSPPLARETESQPPVVNKTQEPPQMTDPIMQDKIEADALQSGNEVTEGEEDEDSGEETRDSLEEGEINDDTSEEQKGVRKQRIQYERSELLSYKGSASKDALAGMNSIPPEVMKDSTSRPNLHQRGSPSPSSFSHRVGQHGGSRDNRMNRAPPLHGMRNTMGMSGFSMMIPPPPPGGHHHASPRVVMELNREEVKLHKAEKAWKPTPVKSRSRGAKDEPQDEEEIIKDEIIKKTRGILNKLTPENFDKLVVAFLELNLDDKDDRIAAVILVVFEKAIDEPSFSTAYANMVKTVCDRSQTTARKFRKNILDQCQKEFTKGSNAEEELKSLEEKLATAEDDKKEELKLEMADKKFALRRRSLGNVRFIGELYKLQMLTPKIMIECVNNLLGSEDEEGYEALCKLLSTIGQRLDNQLKELEQKAILAKNNPHGPPPKYIPPEKYMDKTFAQLKALSGELKLSSRIRFALLDVVELRDSFWKPRRDADGPKKIGEVHRDAIRQQQEEKQQIQNLPPQGQMRSMQPPKKQSDWNTVTASNKSSRFMKKPVVSSSSGESSGPFTLAPNRGSSWNPSSLPGPGGPPKTNFVLPPRMQPNQGRFGMLSEDRVPSTPLRENIVQDPPPPLRTQGSRESSRPQTPTRDAPQKPEPPAIQPLMPPSQLPREVVDVGESVKNTFQEFFSTSSWDDLMYYVNGSFPGDKVLDFVDELSRQVCEMSKENQQKCAGALVKGLVKRGRTTKTELIEVFSKGVMVDMPDIQVDVPKITSYLGVFLVELFLDEPDLSWLIPLGDKIEEEFGSVWTDLVTNTLNFLKFRLSEEAVQVLYKKTPGANKLPVQELPWIAGESVEALSKKMLLVLEKEKDSATISHSFKENSWDLREELTGKSLTEAICQISWKEASGWDIPALQKLLPQLNTASPVLHAKLWGQAKEFMKRNSIEGPAEDQLWTEMNRLKLVTPESRRTSYC